MFVRRKSIKKVYQVELFDVFKACILDHLFVYNLKSNFSYMAAVIIAGDLCLALKWLFVVRVLLCATLTVTWDLCF
jgi:hypothetical protein